MPIYYAKLTKEGESPKFDQIVAPNVETAKINLKTINKDWRITGLGEFLCEAKLWFFLNMYFFTYNFEIVYDKKIKGNDNIRPDFQIINNQNNQIILIVEFDGYQHYTKAQEVLKDVTKDLIYKGLGYKVIRLPYFIQIRKEIVDHFFCQGFPYDNSYLHGFIDPKVTLPSDFCELGMMKFLKDMKRFNIINPTIPADIVKSLKCKITTLEFNNKTIIPKNVIGRTVLSKKYQNKFKIYGW